MLLNINSNLIFLFFIRNDFEHIKSKQIKFKCSHKYFEMKSMFHIYLSLTKEDYFSFFTTVSLVFHKSDATNCTFINIRKF